MSVRNIRNHQSRGLLPPPEVRARTGYYGPEHVARLRLIQQMQAEGFNLGAIQRLIGEEGPGADRFAAIRELIADPGAGRAARGAQRRGADRPVRADRPEGAGPGAQAGGGGQPGRRPLRGAEPRAAARGRRAARPRRDAVDRARACWTRCGATPRAPPACSWSCSWRRCGSPSTARAGPTSAGPRSPSRSRACARWPRTPCWPSSARCWRPRWRTPSASSCATRAGVRARARVKEHVHRAHEPPTSGTALTAVAVSATLHCRRDAPSARCGHGHRHRAGLVGLGHGGPGRGAGLLLG